jgi:hypothetical protein
MKSAQLFASLLLIVCSLSFFSCSKQEAIATETKDILTQGQWKVDYYFSDQDRTAQLADYSFQFNANGSMNCVHNSNVCNGNWKIIRNVNGSDLLEINIPAVNNDLQQLNLTWKITGVYLQTLAMQGEAQSQYQLRIAKN